MVTGKMALVLRLRLGACRVGCSSDEGQKRLNGSNAMQQQMAVRSTAEQTLAVQRVPRALQDYLQEPPASAPHCCRADPVLTYCKQVCRDLTESKLVTLGRAKTSKQSCDKTS